MSSLTAAVFTSRLDWYRKRGRSRAAMSASPLWLSSHPHAACSRTTPWFERFNPSSAVTSQMTDKCHCSVLYVLWLSRQHCSKYLEYVCTQFRNAEESHLNTQDEIDQSFLFWFGFFTYTFRVFAFRQEAYFLVKFLSQHFLSQTNYTELPIAPKAHCSEKTHTLQLLDYGVDAFFGLLEFWYNECLFLG